MTLSAIDVCAGAGGLSLGLASSGWDVLGVERDADACETHRAQVGPCDCADVCSWHPAGPVTLVAGGVPCQPFSLAGKRQGTRDVRGSLFEQLVRVAVESSARVVLLENVRGMVSLGMVPVIEAAYRAAGYEPSNALLNAADYGTFLPCPLHASSSQTDCAAFVASNSPAATKPGSAAGRATTTRENAQMGDALCVASFLVGPMSAAFAGAATALERLERLLLLARKEPKTARGREAGFWTIEAMSGLGLEEDTAESIVWWLSSLWDGLYSQGRLSTTSTGTPRTTVQKILRCIATTVITGLHTGAAGYLAGCGLCVDEGVPQNRVRLFVVGFRRAEDLARWRWPSPSHGAPGNLLGLPPWRTVRQALGLEGKRGRSLRLDRPAPTVCGGGTETGGAEPLGNQRVRLELVADGAPVRLSVAQLAALQGFPPGFAFHGNSTSQHRQCGNAVPPPLAEALGRALLAALDARATVAA